MRTRDYKKSFFIYFGKIRLHLKITQEFQYTHYHSLQQEENKPANDGGLSDNR